MTDPLAFQTSLEVIGGNSIMPQVSRLTRCTQLVVTSSQTKTEVTVHKVIDGKKVYIAFCFKKQNMFPVVEKDPKTNKVNLSMKTKPNEPFPKSYLFEMNSTGDYGSLRSKEEPWPYLSISKDGKIILSNNPDPRFKIQPKETRTNTESIILDSKTLSGFIPYNNKTSPSTTFYMNKKRCEQSFNDVFYTSFSVGTNRCLDPYNHPSIPNFSFPVGTKGAWNPGTHGTRQVTSWIGYPSTAGHKHIPTHTPNHSLRLIWKPELTYNPCIYSVRRKLEYPVEPRKAWGEHVNSIHTYWMQDLYTPPWRCKATMQSTAPSSLSMTASNDYIYGSHQFGFRTDHW